MLDSFFSSIMHLNSGLKAMMPLLKQIDDEQLPENKKVVKLRFTSKQYSAFRDACKIFELVSSDPGFIPLVKSALGANIKEPTISKQFINPIIDAPTKIPIKIPKLAEPSNKKESYFIAPTNLTKSGRKLYHEIKSVVDKTTLKHDIDKGITCITDIRILLTKYIEFKQLKTELGTTLDDFIISLAPNTVNDNLTDLMAVSNKILVIPKGNRKIITGIINEITFDKKS